MATFEDDQPKPKPTVAQRAAAIVAAPVRSSGARVVTLLALAAAAGSLAAFPYGPLAAAAVAVVAFETGRKR